MKFIHLTDTHFVPAGRKLYGIDPTARLRAAVDSINAEHADADFVIITGDLAHKGEIAAYESLRDLLDRLVIPYHLLMGNHDDRANLRRVFPSVPVDDDGFLQYALDVPSGHFIALDTMEPGTHGGNLCDLRLTWLKARLDEAQGRDVFVFLHHPAFDTGIPSMDAIGLSNRDKLGDLLAAHGRVRHMFFGHLHRPLCGSWRGIPFSTLRGLNHQVALDLRNASKVPGCLEPPAYAVVLLRGEAVLVHSHDFLDQSPRFLLADRRAASVESSEDLRNLGSPDLDPSLN